VLAIAGLSGCKPQDDPCSGFPAPGGFFSVLALFPPQFSGESPREITYSEARPDDAKVLRAREVVALCYPRKPHSEFKDSLKYMRFAGARVSPSGKYYLLYEFLNVTDARVVVELNREGQITRSMTGSMVDG